MFVLDQMVPHIVVTVIIALVMNLAHSWLVGPLFIRMSGSRVMGVFFFLAYTALTVWLCIHTTNLLNSPDGINTLYGVFVSLMCISLSGMHAFAPALYADDWEEIDYLDWEEKSGLFFWWAAPAVIASIFLHPIAVCVLFVIGAVIVTWIAISREY